MSALDNLKEQIKSLGLKLWQQIQESPAFAQLKDRYENMTPSAQKMSLATGALFIVLLLFFLPLSYLSDSQVHLSAFEERRNLIRDLFKTYRDSSATPAVTPPPPLESLRSSIESILASAELLPEQNIGVSEGAVEGRLIPSALVANVLQIRLAKLNLKQIVDIGSSLVALSDSVKMKDLLISAHRQDTRYYDVTYQLYSLKVPTPTAEAAPEPEKPTKKTRDSNE